MNEVLVLDQMQETLRINNFSVNIEKAYLYWTRAFLTFHGDRPPQDLGLNDVEAFLEHLKEERFAVTRTLDQALHAIRFLYKDVLAVDCPWLDKYIQQRDGKRNRNILSPKECQRVLSFLFGQDWLIASLIYGSGMRLVECVRLRIRDINFQDKSLLVRKADGDVGRQTVLPAKMVAPLRAHLEDRKLLHIKDIADGFGEVYLPAKIARDYPDAARSWGWQYVFPSSQRDADLRAGGKVRRKHVDEKSIKRAVEHAAIEAGVYKQASADTLRNSFAVHLIQNGVDVKAVEALLGHGDEESQIATAHLETKSPLDHLMIH